jgi:hypothetical protein
MAEIYYQYLLMCRTIVFAPNSSLGEQIKGAYMPSWVLLGMTAVEERVRKRTTKL